MTAAIDNFRTAFSRYVTGETVSVLASFTDVVSVDTRRGVPIVVLNNGAVGRYESGSGTNTLVFSYTVSESDRSVAALKGVRKEQLPGYFLPPGIDIYDDNAFRLPNASNLFAKYDENRSDL